MIVTNPLNHEGGVVNYYNLFFKHFNSEKFELKHHSIGSRAYLFYYPILKRILYPFYLLFDVFIYTVLLIFDRRIKIVQVSPSLIPVPLIRDGMLIIIAKLLRKRTIVFYRGWKMPTLKILKSSKILTWIFNMIFQSNSQQVVLASSFKRDLLELRGGCIGTKILISTTAIEKDSIISQQVEDEKIKVLFLGRIQDLKGVEEIIDSILELDRKNALDNFKFSIVGHEFKKGYSGYLKSKLKEKGISESKVQFLNRTTGEKKFQLYAEHDLFLLPSYTEGCPNSVLEALATGLYCITTSVGALKDIIEPNFNGLIVEKKNASSLTRALLSLKGKKEFRQKRNLISEDSIVKFDISSITKNFENLYMKQLN